ncbi:Putative signal transducing protein [Pustulibacterium marinum]|uniref:Putative signal transducing protein n=1 Tax=Pustulibacterium marinum TaxID=1224947 RepID=A0A1I7GZ46_9FLAO|nr:DUF2007 domain-containing protein [Pustulibacterium marinum]SFU53731.1 Putative signal transducing protein [Pustulibacterium marinum]
MDQKKNDVHKVYTGPMITAQMIMERLEDRGIETIQEDDYFSGTEPNTEEGVVENIDVYVDKDDLVKAQQVIEESYTDLLDDNNNTYY